MCVCVCVCVCVCLHFCVCAVVFKLFLRAQSLCVSVSNSVKPLWRLLFLCLGRGLHDKNVWKRTFALMHACHRCNAAILHVHALICVQLLWINAFMLCANWVYFHYSCACSVCAHCFSLAITVAPFRKGSTFAARWRLQCAILHTGGVTFLLFQKDATWVGVNIWRDMTHEVQREQWSRSNLSSK